MYVYMYVCYMYTVYDNGHNMRCYINWSPPSPQKVAQATNT